MRTSCIPRPENFGFVYIREEYLRICGGNHCQAALLNAFEQWHNFKLAKNEQELERRKSDPKHSPDLSTWVWGKDAKALCLTLLSMWKEDAVRGATVELEKKGFLESCQDPTDKFSRTKWYRFVVKPVLDAVSALKSTVPKKSALECREIPTSNAEEIGTLNTEIQSSKIRMDGESVDSPCAFVSLPVAVVEESGKTLAVVYPLSGEQEKNGGEPQKKPTATDLAYDKNGNGVLLDISPVVLPDSHENGNGRKRKKPPPASSPQAWRDETFEIAYGLCWLKKGKDEARKAWGKLPTRTIAEQVIEAVRQQRELVIQHAIVFGHSPIRFSTWLNEGRWKDDIEDLKRELRLGSVDKRSVNTISSIAGAIERAKQRREGQNADQ